MQNGTAALENSLVPSYKVKLPVPCDQQGHPRYLLQENENVGSHQNLYTVYRALLIIPQTRKQQGPSMG